MPITLLQNIAYLIAAVLFILGLKKLSSPSTARSGNLLGALGMLLAIGVTLIDRQIISFSALLAGLGVGAVVGVVTARAIKMTAMPQMVALLNGLGGGASMLVAWGEFIRVGAKPLDVSLAIMASTLVGGSTLSGSLIAFAKLQGWMTGKPITYWGQNVSNLGLLLLGLGLSIALVVALPPAFYVPLILLALLIGMLFVIPIGGADMPVVIAFLNAASGLAAACTGFVLHNNMLIIAGALVGASGVILTRIMCQAMHRTLGNVFFSAFGKAAGPPQAGTMTEERLVRDVSAEDVAVLMVYSKLVVVVPGYGMAVAQAQHALKELTDVLEAKGVEVKYGIHPVAGRMPGHMNVLLAEANVPYEKLFEMERINPEFDNTDVVLAIGANDVINPAARNDRSSPLYGMPILDVDKARNIIVVKRSLNPGFAGVDNALFYNEKTWMFFRDAKVAVNEVIASIKSV